VVLNCGRLGQHILSGGGLTLQQAIENHGIIGDLRTAALVDLDGCIDWLCLPKFDSPSVFASLLDKEKGGEFRISPHDGKVTHKQFYWPDTNILITRFLSPDGVGEIIDYMPMGEREASRRRRNLVRHVRAVRGSMPFHVDCRPAFNYARDRHQVQTCGEDGVIFHAPGFSLQLATKVPLKITEEGGAVAEFTLHEGESAVFLLEMIERGGRPAPALNQAAEHAIFSHTVQYWRRWISRCTYHGRWGESVRRSALALKLLTCEATGAVVAAPTCSLPECIGGERNWDYRYTWIRDAAFTLYGLLRIGFTEEASSFMKWIEARCHELNPDGSLQTMYRLDGGHEIEEVTLDHLCGYRDSRPVRIGNAAYGQLQLDIYGALMDSVYLYNKYGSPISYELWQNLRRLLNWVAANWRRDDRGIWEVRGDPQQFVYSKVMCWVALDRGVRLADKRSFPADRERWLKERDAIYEEIFLRGWSDKRQAFVQSYGSNALDASTLIMPLVFFMSPSDPRMLKTLDAMCKPGSSGGLMADSLVYRYDVRETDDGLAGSEGTFNICTFWLVEAMTRAARVQPWRLDEARLLFEKMLGFANHLGLYAEETGSCGDALGNFPQAFTHLGLISAAFNLNRALGDKNSYFPGVGGSV
jgi:GH15 family glucan-1,4-alpha-glucosidase